MSTSGSTSGISPQQREQLIALLVDSVVDYAIFALDAGGRVQTWNPGARRLKGYERDQIVGRHFSVFYPPPDRQAGLPDIMLRRALREGRVQHEGWRVRADGSRFWAEVTITALREDDGDHVGFAKVTRDLTERHEAEAATQRALERERQAAAELAELDQLRTRLLAGISHDLSTPIAAIRGCVELLTTDDPDIDPPERDELIALIQRNTETLHRLNAQLSELSRLERGRLELDREDLDVGQVARSCVEDLGPLLDGLDVRIDVEGRARADRLAVQRSLTNLLTNAAAHSPEGGTLRIIGAPRGDHLAVGVADEGPGVPQQERDLIFEEFRRGTGRMERDGPSGLGLGLSIVRHYVERHGGTVWVESEPGAGATFWFTLPTPNMPQETS